MVEISASQPPSEATGGSTGTPAGPDVPSPMETAFAPPRGTTWNRVDPVLTWYRRLLILAATIPSAAVVGLCAGLWAGWGWSVPLVALVLAAGALGWVTAPRVHASWGYAEGPTDFHLTHGVLVRQLIVIPYGRMQVVDVTANLLEQALGIATVRVRTAATTTDARVPGLRLEAAAQLRDRLAARSETFSTGL
ncbi:PH domain-containing protein [Marinactinospora endophytica]